MDAGFRRKLYNMREPALIYVLTDGQFIFLSLLFS